MSEATPTIAPDALLDAVGMVFESLGRALVCLDRSFRVVHGSATLDELFGPGAAREVRGRPASEVFGRELFGEGSPVRSALEEGQMREGWGATVRIEGYDPRLASVTVAPVRRRPGAPCDPRVAFLAVLRPAEEHPTGNGLKMFYGMVARSPAMLRIFQLIEQLRGSDATVVITGESGTGKELVARALHLHSPRRNEPFVAVNCGALPGELLESELFGHVRGAFTGAVRDRVGRFEAAGTGTLFLDEVGDLPLPLQVKLLRVLQHGTFERVGESVTRGTEARVIAATNKDLRRVVDEGLFRDDLYYRLRVVPIHIAPLCDRIDDIEPIARHLLGRLNRHHGRSVKMSGQTIRKFRDYSWPGNVRELENALEYGLALCTGQSLLPDHLPPEIGGAAPSGTPAEEKLAADGLERDGKPAEDRGTALDPEARRILEALESHHWRREETAQALAISRTTLWRRMRELGIDE